MKSIEVGYRGNTSQFMHIFIETFAEELTRAAGGENNLNNTILNAICCKCIDEMNFVRESGLRKNLDITNIKIELTVLKSGAAKFTFIPINEGKQPLFEEKECPILIVGPTPEDIQQESKSKNVFEIFTPPDKNPNQN